MKRQSPQPSQLPYNVVPVDAVPASEQLQEPPQNPNLRVQTTVSVASGTLFQLDHLAALSGVSRSRLVDLACRKLLRWAADVNPKDVRLIADYEVNERTSGFMPKVRR